MYSQWIGMEHYRMHLFEAWPDKRRRWRPRYSFAKSAPPGAGLHPSSSSVRTPHPEWLPEAQGE